MKNNSTKILSIAVILLLIANIALVTMMVLHKKKNRDGWRDGKGGPFEMMAKELNMTDEQEKQYNQLKDQHFNLTQPLFDSLRNARTAFFSLVKQDAENDSLLQAYSNRKASIQLEIDKLTLAHFKKVRVLFNPEQQQKFDEFVTKMIERNWRKKDSARRK